MRKILGALILTAGLFVAIGGSSASSAPACDLDASNGTKEGVWTVIHGTAASEVICGTTGRDKIYGWGGNDIIYGYRGSDRLYGGGGDDVIYGGLGHDIVNGQAGNDTLYGQGGDDTVKGAGGRDDLDGGPGINITNGGAGLDECKKGRLVYCETGAKQILDDTNAYRASKGRAPLVWNPSLARNVSQPWAKHMHDTCRLVHRSSGFGLAENIAQGQKVEKVVDAWIASPPHRKNLLGPYKSIGIGFYEGPKCFKTYFVQNFG